MPIPALNEYGLLPAAIHDCTLDELKNRFGSFQISDRRLQLFRRFEQFVADAQAAQFPRNLLIDGSFVTGEPAPKERAEALWL